MQRNEPSVQWMPRRHPDNVLGHYEVKFGRHRFGCENPREAHALAMALLNLGPHAANAFADSWSKEGQR